MKTIAIFGDSVAAGRFHDEIQHKLDEFLKIELDARGYRDYLIKNFGELGASTETAVKKVDETAAVKPALTVVNIGINDAINIRDNQKTYAANLTKIIETLKSAGSKIIVMGPSYVDSARKPQADQKILQEYAQICREIAEKEHVPFVDVYDTMTSFIDKNKFLQPDGLHPSLFGYHLLAVLIADQMDQMK